ncbi:uncharacterized protein [Amphiura filiformis]|uniref:uncharacterized protein n=1 Tax=Amphiura filiformis TaxID=82378 RepID=UPI003B228785
MAFLPWAITILVLIGAILSTICQRDRKAQYYIKNFFFFWWYMGTAALVIPIAIFRPGDSINMGWWAFWVKYTFTTWMFGVSVKTKNAEGLQFDGPCVIVCNHQTAMDQVVVLELWPSGRSTIMAKKSLKYAGTFGLAGMLSGLIFVDRNNTAEAKSRTTKECIDYLNVKKGKLWVYPEGTRSGNRQEHMLPFKKGAFHIAVEAQVPIVPVVMSAYKSMYSDRKKIFSDIDLKITVLPKISTEGLKPDDVTSLADRVRDAMLETYYKTSPHVERPVAMEMEDKPQTPEDLQSREDNESNELAKEIETVSSKIYDSDQKENENIGGEFYDQEQTKSENSDDIGAKKQNEYNSELGQNNEGLKTDENEDKESVDSPPNETKTSTEGETVSDLSKSELLVDFSEAVNNKDDHTTSKLENDDSPSSQASSDSFVFVNSSKLDDEGNTEHVESSPETSTKEDVCVAKEESQNVLVENLGEISVEQQECTSQQDVCAEDSKQDDPIPNSE